MILLKNVSKSYSDQKRVIHALNHVSLEVKTGEIFGVIGRSGAGKSTLIRCLNLLEKPDQGEVIIDECNLMQLNSHALQNMRRQIGMIFQHFNLLSHRTVFENVALPLKLIGQSKQEIYHKVNQLLVLVGLSDKMNNYPAQLSGGQKQRVCIARALITQPKILLCDEATSALDPETTTSILDLLKKIHQEFNLTLFMITHQMEVIKDIAQRVAVLEKGEVIEENTVVNIFTQPQKEVTQQLVKSTLPQQLPQDFERQIIVTPFENSAMVLRLSFHQNASGEPAMTELVRRFNLTISILQGNIEVIQRTSIGVLFIEIWGEQQDIQQALDYLSTKNIGTQVIGYVHRNN